MTERLTKAISFLKEKYGTIKVTPYFVSYEYQTEQVYNENGVTMWYCPKHQYVSVYNLIDEERRDLCDLANIPITEKIGILK